MTQDDHAGIDLSDASSVEVPLDAAEGPFLVLEALAEDAGHRLDVVLARRLPVLSRRKAQEMLERGSIRLTGRRARKGDRVRTGDRLELLEPPVSSEFAALPDATLDLGIVLEDAWLAVVDKPAGMPSHPLRPMEVGTVASFVAARWPTTCLVGYRAREPGIVHRLDTGTSGVLLVAKDAPTFDALRGQLEAGTIDKRYVALVAPSTRLEVGLHEAWIGNDPRDPRRVAVTAVPGLDARACTTDVLRVVPGPRATRVELRAPHAFRHQIRAHLAWLGAPLLGDPAYGGSLVPGLDRHALHASELRFNHPHTERPVRVVSGLPTDLAGLLDDL